MNCPECGKYRLRHIKEYTYRNKKTGKVVEQTVEGKCPRCGDLKYRIEGPPGYKGIIFVGYIWCYVVVFLKWLWRSILRKLNIRT